MKLSGATIPLPSYYHSLSASSEAYYLQAMKTMHIFHSWYGTTWYDLNKTLFPSSNIVLTGDQTESFQNLIKGKCNVIQGEQYEAPELEPISSRLKWIRSTMASYLFRPDQLQARERSGGQRAHHSNHTARSLDTCILWVLRHHLHTMSMGN